MLREQNGYKEETDEEFLSEALTLLRKITDEAAKKILLAQIKAISTLWKSGIGRPVPFLLPTGYQSTGVDCLGNDL